MEFNIELYKNLNQADKYNMFLKELESYLKEETDTIANLSNMASFINVFFEELNWSGFYLYKENKLVLGPFYGFPATTRIAVDKGVCGAAFTKREAIIVANVCEFPGHIACDIRSKSEIVIPLINKGKIYGVLDIDSSVHSRFTPKDAEILNSALELLYKYSDLDKILIGEKIVSSII
ncbi:MAG: GAF domain-containing protein [Fusobacteriaceae bacterium]